MCYSNWKTYIILIQITLPTGTRVTFNYGKTYVDGINIIPSVLDTDATKGLCGIYNGDPDDDFLPRDQVDAVTDVKTFASSWKYVLDNCTSLIFLDTSKIRTICICVVKTWF